ncbi:MAG: hypothetical protein PHU85_15155, partial [Phycisphaerae bacterium]|nr:hypothetical protein [Phycisphaerae bacterium]
MKHLIWSNHVHAGKVVKTLLALEARVRRERMRDVTIMVGAGGVPIEGHPGPGVEKAIDAIRDLDALGVEAIPSLHLVNEGFADNPLHPDLYGDPWRWEQLARAVARYDDALPGLKEVAFDLEPYQSGPGWKYPEGDATTACWTAMRALIDVLRARKLRPLALPGGHEYGATTPLLEIGGV